MVFHIVIHQNNSNTLTQPFPFYCGGWKTHLAAINIFKIALIERTSFLFIVMIPQKKDTA